MTDARFAVFCDRPCDAIDNSIIGGYNQVDYANTPVSPNIAAFIINGANPFPGDVDYVLGVQSKDDLPVHIIDVKILEVEGRIKRTH